MVIPLGVYAFAKSIFISEMDMPYAAAVRNKDVAVRYSHLSTHDNHSREYNSCGLFALNAIRHHYLPQDFPLLQSDYLLVVCYRLEIALGLLSESTVSTYYKKHLSQL